MIAQRNQEQMIMANFILVYIGGEQPTNPKEAEQHFKEYREWLISLGDVVVSPVNPLKDTVSISPNGAITRGSMAAMSGFTIIKADSIDTVIEMAKSCPFLDIGGSLEISELLHMGSDTSELN